MDVGPLTSIGIEVCIDTDLYRKSVIACPSPVRRNMLDGIVYPGKGRWRYLRKKAISAACACCAMISAGACDLYAMDPAGLTSSMFWESLRIAGKNQSMSGSPVLVPIDGSTEEYLNTRNPPVTR